jgi:hypothetical protein
VAENYWTLFTPGIWKVLHAVLQRKGAYRLQFGRGYRISAREQGNLVAERNEFLGQERNDPFGASVELWWHRFI